MSGSSGSGGSGGNGGDSGDAGTASAATAAGISAANAAAANSAMGGVMGQAAAMGLGGIAMGNGGNPAGTSTQGTGSFGFGADSGNAGFGNAGPTGSSVSFGAPGIGPSGGVSTAAVGPGTAASGQAAANGVAAGFGGPAGGIGGGSTGGSNGGTGPGGFGNFGSGLGFGLGTRGHGNNAAAQSDTAMKALLALTQMRYGFVNGNDPGMMASNSIANLFAGTDQATQVAIANALAEASGLGHGGIGSDAAHTAVGESTQTPSPQNIQALQQQLAALYAAHAQNAPPSQVNVRPTVQTVSNDIANVGNQTSVTPPHVAQQPINNMNTVQVGNQTYANAPRASQPAPPSLAAAIQAAMANNTGGGLGRLQG